MVHGKFEPFLPERRVEFMETGDTAAKHPFGSTEMFHRKLDLLKEGFEFPRVAKVTVWQTPRRVGRN